MNRNQRKIKCSNGFCLTIFDLDKVKTVEVIEEGRVLTKAYCPVCANSEIVKMQQKNG